ncbi:tetratricopeptide repeat protein [Aneurinibacillus thermoaerophilus]|uniref:tetratricopeptide repeat protein n=1 Tax=Aneurinibacillus thermoaerophilus TaxID=143495 RepID=UPI002E1ACC59|nr:tetratricopeptide repeat protein [Aneurinibacillus thermoaerophilus]
MLLSHYFAALKDRLNLIEQQMETASEGDRNQLYCEVLKLRQISDRIVEEWLSFEDRLIKVQRMFEEAEDASVSSQLHDVTAEEETEEEIYLPYTLAATFRQGQGYFTLSMYHEAVESFSKVLEEAPDVAVARLYLAFGFLMSGRLDVAYRQFHLLTETCVHPFICAASYNAMGCIAMMEGNPEQGLGWFEQALWAFDQFADARYNQALALCHLGRYEEAIQTARPLLRGTAPDVDVLLLLGACCAKSHRFDEAYTLLQRAEALAYQGKQHQAIARIYEQTGKFEEAARCYREMLPASRADASVWHGLGWSLWQSGQKEQALACMKRALTLSPDQPDYACSYAWILLCEGEAERAWKVFEQTARKYQHPLARAGMVETLLKQHHFVAAEEIISNLSKDQNAHIRALGQYLKGRLLLMQGKREEALEYFSLSHRAGVIRESGLYAGLLHYADGAHEEAYERWKEFIPAP